MSPLGVIDEHGVWYLVGFVGVMEVHDPPEVREARVQTGRLLIERYHETTAPGR